MNCEMAKMLINEYIDGRLDSERQFELISHIKTCPHCAEELKRSELLKELLKNMPQAEPPAGLLPGAIKKAKDELRQEKRPALVKRAVAIAAAVVVTLGIGWYLYTSNPPVGEMAPQAAPAPAEAYDMAEEAPKMMIQEAPSEGAPLMEAAMPSPEPASSSAPASDSAPAASAAENGEKTAAGSNESTAVERTGDADTFGSDVRYTIPESEWDAFFADLGEFVQKYGIAERNTTDETNVESIGFVLPETAAGDFSALLVKYNIETGDWPAFPFEVRFVFSKP